MSCTKLCDVGWVPKRVRQGANHPRASVREGPQKWKIWQHSLISAQPTSHVKELMTNENLLIRSIKLESSWLTFLCSLCILTTPYRLWHPVYYCAFSIILALKALPPVLALRNQTARKEKLIIPSLGKNARGDCKTPAPLVMTLDEYKKIESVDGCKFTKTAQ